MKRVQRRRLFFTLLRGALLTAIALAADQAGYLTRAEHVLYDLRLAHCEGSMPPPTDKLVHLDIDEDALAQVGRWPWPREVLAQIIDELRLARPKVLAMDVLYAEPGEVHYDRNGSHVDPDAVLAKSLKEFGGALIASSLTFQPPEARTPLELELEDLLERDPELTAEQCIAKLRGAGFADADLDVRASRTFVIVRPQAIYERIEYELAAGVADPAVLRQKLLPHADPLLTGSILGRLFDEQYDRAVRERGMNRFTLDIPPGLEVLHATGEITPVLRLSQAAAYGGFVDYLPDGVEGTVRSVPLFASYQNRLIPHMSLVAACAMLNVDIHSLRISADSVIIPQPGGHDIVIPVSTRRTSDIGAAGLLMQVPIFGTRAGWLTMYDHPRHETSAQHVSVYEIWRICETLRKIEVNENAADQVLVDALKLTNQQAASDYAAAPLRGDAKRKLIQSTLDDMGEISKGLASVPDLGPDERQLLARLKLADLQLRELLKQTDGLVLQLGKFRADLYNKVHDRTLFLGGTATGQLDMHPTSLHFSCPGIVVHGAVFNGILTGRMWRVLPLWINVLVAIALGMLTTAVVAGLGPAKAFIMAASIATAYLAFNGYVLFGHYKLVVGAAGPLLAVGLVWSGVTLSDFIIEVAERTRITRRFRSYVDPALVDWVIDHPEQARFDGEVREMTMAFSDLAGFTSLTEKMGERTVPLLAEYMAKMVPVIRAHQGFVAKLMGDGIYYFFGAPKINPAHASNAVGAALEMHAALADLNVSLTSRALPVLGMRIGISTGTVVIGDAGTPDASDYTALGDTVNLASRLETANKIFGTHTLISARTVELLNGAFLVRPIANLCVAGKTEGVVVYEPLCRTEAATPELRSLAQRTQDLWDKFRTGSFADCIEILSDLEAEAGSDGVAAFYRRECEAHLISPPSSFDGRIMLSHK